MTNAWHLATDADRHPWAPHINFTRTPEPAAWSSKRFTCLDELQDFTDDEALQAIAHHEAGHVALLVQLKLPFDGLRYQGPNLPAAIEMDPNPKVLLNGNNHMIMLAAGEKAEQRWLHESGLHTPERAWAAERLSWSDRQAADRFSRSGYRLPLEYGSGHPWTCWGRRGEQAEKLLDLKWAQTLRIAKHLTQMWSSGKHYAPAGSLRAVFASGS